MSTISWFSPIQLPRLSLACPPDTWLGAACMIFWSLTKFDKVKLETEKAQERGKKRL